MRYAWQSCVGRLAALHIAAMTIHASTSYANHVNMYTCSLLHVADVNIAWWSLHKQRRITWDNCNYTWRSRVREAHGGVHEYTYKKKLMAFYTGTCGPRRWQGKNKHNKWVITDEMRTWGPTYLQNDSEKEYVAEEPKAAVAEKPKRTYHASDVRNLAWAPVILPRTPGLLSR